MRIVIVEDEILIREGVMRLVSRLSPDSAFVGEANNGRAGMALILAERPDLVITDIRMPDMDGLTMLETVREQGCSCKAIVLTAYSEFAYAKQAVRLGVIEYLLKPIVVDDFIQALRRAERMTAQEAAEPKHPEALRSLRLIYRAVLTGMTPDREVEAYLRDAYGLDANSAFTVAMLAPCRRLSDDDWSALHGVKQRLCRERGDSARLIELPSERMVALVAGGAVAPNPPDGFAEALRSGLPEGAFVAGFQRCAGLRSLHAAMRRVMERMDMALSLGASVMDMDALPDDASLRPLVYPIALEQQAKAALWSRDAAQTERVTARFLETLLDGAAPHRPREIKECCVRFLWALGGAAADMAQAEQPERQALLERVMSAVTRAELRAAVDAALRTLRARTAPDAEGAPASDMVARACAQVREFYGTGVTLEEIAARLKVTPEYLSQQFHREMGVKFSAYIRGVRIEKAKELLRVTELKIYEVAERVGYADAKYFAKVFRQETGEMPVAFRAHG